LHYATPGNRMQYHVPAPAGGSNFGGAAAVQTGEGSRPNHDKRNIRQFFDQVSKGIQKILKEEKAPMILAGVEYLHPMYREANLYHNLLPEGIQGNPKGVADATLREQGWGIVKPYFEQTKRDAVAEYHKSAGTGLTAVGFNDVIPAAYHGRVRFLFTADNIQERGKFNPETNSVEIHKTVEKTDDDLMDYAAFQTLNHSGTIFVFKPEEVPGKAPISAILRF
jgi:hypothetical protein